MNSLNHNVKFLNAVIFALFGFKFLSILSVKVNVVEGIPTSNFVTSDNYTTICNLVTDDNFVICDNYETYGNFVTKREYVTGGNIATRRRFATLR